MKVVLYLVDVLWYVLWVWGFAFLDKDRFRASYVRGTLRVPWGERAAGTSFRNQAYRYLRHSANELTMVGLALLGNSSEEEC